VPSSKAPRQAPWHLWQLWISWRKRKAPPRSISTSHLLLSPFLHFSFSESFFFCSSTYSKSFFNIVLTNLIMWCAIIEGIDLWRFFICLDLIHSDEIKIGNNHIEYGYT
jgi:hypothetical protein